MKFATFIVVDDTVSRNGDEFTFTVNGDVIYPLETPMPVIRKGKGCIGIGYVVISSRTSASTSITFTLAKCNPEAAKAYYDLYQNQISVSNNTDDVYDNASDMVIPGMMAGASMNRKKNMKDLEDDSRSRHGNRRGNARSLSDILNDDDDDYHW